MSERIDKYLVELFLVESRSKAQELIRKGLVTYKGQVVTKSSMIIEDPQKIKLEGNLEFVSRGAYKIQGAATFFQVAFEDLIIADIGASTGGFTDFALQQGAKKVYAIDVGHDQLAHSLRNNSRVINMEGVNIRFPLELNELADLAVVDLSYISLKLTLETIWSLVHNQGKILCLVKPQFEIGKEGIGKKGIVKNSESHLKVLEDLYRWCLDREFFIAGLCSSPILGKTGNKEFFFYFDKSKNHMGFSLEDIERLGLANSGVGNE